MKKIGLILSLMVVGLLLMTSNAMAILYYPDLLFNNTGIAEYNSTTKKLTITAESLNVVFDGTSSGKYWIDHTAIDDVSFSAEYLAGGYGGSAWYFQGDSVISPDIDVEGKLLSAPTGFPNTGQLILGNITGMQFDGKDRIQGLFDITGGDLYPYYASGYKGVFDITLEFSGGTAPSDPDSGFKSNGAKGDISASPEPTSLLLLGSGLLGLAALGRKKKRS